MVLVLAAGQGLSGAGAGLAAGANGEALKDGRPFRGIGVNAYDAFVRTISEPGRPVPVAAFQDLARRGIPFVRFSAGGYWPVDWGLYRTNRTEYFKRFDAVVDAAREAGIGLVPSLFWHLSTVPDLAGEPCRAWGDPGSRTHHFMREYVREVVSRHRDSAAVWAWEFGNEYNLAADLPNAAEHRPPVVPQLGTPAVRSGRDEVSHGDIRVALREFAREVRRHDPVRLIISGHAFPRPSAWHQIHRRSWDTDSRQQFREVLLADHPEPVGAVSVRLYDRGSDLARLGWAADDARSAGRVVFVGEFGVPGPDADRDGFEALLDALEVHRVPLAALWVYDYDAQASDWNVTPLNARSWQLDRIALRNRLWAAEAEESVRRP